MSNISETSAKKSSFAISLSTLVRVFSLAALVTLLWFVVDVRTLVDSFQKIKLSTVIFCFIAEMLFCAIESLRICFLSRGRFVLTSVLRARFLTGFMGNFLPGVVSADAMRILLINRGKKDGLLYTALLIIANRVYGLLALFGLLLLTLLFYQGNLPSFIEEKRWFIVLLCLVTVTLPLALRIRSVRFFSAKTLRLLPRTLRKPMRSVYLAGISFVNLRNWSFCLITSMITGALAVFQFWLVGQAVAVDISFQLWVFIIPFITLATLLPLGFGAIGTQDVTLVSIGALLGMRPEPLLAVSVGMHLVRFIGTFPGIFFMKDGLLLAKEMIHKRRKS